MADSTTFRHEALLYAGDDEFVERAAAFIRDGVAEGEPTLVVVDARKIARLREALGADADAVQFADMHELGKNPARIIPAWHDFVDRHAGSGARLRGIGEPIFPERDGDELVECQRHESLLNLAFADAPPFWLLCPYDTTALEADVVDEARRSHPFVASAAGQEPSPTYAGLEGATATLDAPLSEPPVDAAELQFEAGTLDALRRVVADHAADAGLPESRRVDLVVAANEVATNSVKYGGGHGVLRIWSDARRLICEVRDRGRLDDPLVDRRLPVDDKPHGRGLWIANQLCELVQVRSRGGETVVRLHVARA